SDWLAVLQDEFARGNRARCKAMTRRHGSLDFYFTAIGQSDFKPCEGFRFDYRDVVTWVDDDRIVAYRRYCECCAHQSLLVNSIVSARSAESAIARSDSVESRVPDSHQAAGRASQDRRQLRY